MKTQSLWFRISMRVLPVFVSVLILVLAKGAEFYFMPVVKDFHLTHIERVDNKIVMRGYLRKVRDCQFAGVSAAGITEGGKVDLPLKFLDPDSLMDNWTRPTGTQAWGPWRIAVPVAPNVVAIDLESVHSCHIAWPSTTRLARVPIVDELRVEQ